jgi:hypothetical protein
VESTLTEQFNILLFLVSGFCLWLLMNFQIVSWVVSCCQHSLQILRLFTWPQLLKCWRAENSTRDLVSDLSMLIP